MEKQRRVLIVWIVADEAPKSCYVFTPLSPFYLQEASEAAAGIRFLSLSLFGHTRPLAESGVECCRRTGPLGCADQISAAYIAWNPMVAVGLSRSEQQKAEEMVAREISARNPKRYDSEQCTQ